ncbi:hypothetical protein E2C01_002677 [Portunus trituberculatus]|uniref:Transcription factor AP-2 C-terminal domain-containing protein n=1 Tax=Portunus trituberculatus TaxID=210409 RepID=A0A5B7CMK3_PORTR|nr:hypothetical protein [Portunus trituberculatus]
MAGVEHNDDIHEEILSCDGIENEEEIVHIIQDDSRVEESQENEEAASSGLEFWVPPLLAVGREGQRLTVTQEELQRRVSPPECLSQTMLLSLLRLSKEKGRDLRLTLEKNGIKKLTPKSAVISSFTKLTESGRVTAMSVVMGTLGWWWLVIAIATPFLVNFAVYIHTAAQRTPEKIGYFHNCCRYISLIPLALLSSMTISDKRYLTILTTLAWIASYLPQILMFNSHMTNWLVWIVPTVAQICSLIIMMATWKVFEAAFYRFSRLAGTHPWSVTFLRVECTQNVVAQPTHSIM